jgi:hypothetical protein
MQGDPIVDEVRRVRREIERKLGSDRKAFYQYLCKIQKPLGNRVVCRKPRRLTNSVVISKSAPGLQRLPAK